jgi:hypothetical protein
MGDEFVGLFEGVVVEEEEDAFAGGELAFATLAFAAFRAAAVFGEGVAAFEFGYVIWGRGEGWIGHCVDYRQDRGAPRRSGLPLDKLEEYGVPLDYQEESGWAICRAT